MKSELSAKRKDRLYFTSVIVVIVAVLLGVEYFTMVHSKRDQAYQTATMLIDQVRNVLISNEKKEQSLVDSLKEDYIAKAKAVSYIIDNNPGTEDDIAELIRIANLMSIDEIHIFDESGRIYGGTVPPYYGFTFDSGEQMAYFKPMLDNKALSMCQDVTPNTAEGKSMMYAICWNDAGTRMTQIGIEPHRLIEEMRTNEIGDVIAGMPAYDGVDILVADQHTGEVLGSTLPKLLGSTLPEIGIELEGRDLGETAHFRATVGKRPSYCSVGTLHSYVLAVVQERAEVNRDIPLVMLMMFLYLMLAAAAITLIVRRMTRRVLKEQKNANTDAMTGFFNRRAYESDMRDFGMPPYEENLAYASLDLNGLKVVNDTYGHEAGDELIRGAADCMRQCFGNHGKLYRIGGDEFAAIIFATPEQLESIVRDLEQTTEDWSRRRDRKLTLACGCIRAAEYSDKPLFELAKMADTLMYEAKAAYYKAAGIDRRRRGRENDRRSAPAENTSDQE